MNPQAAAHQKAARIPSQIGRVRAAFYSCIVKARERRLTGSTQDAGGGKKASIVREGTDNPSIAMVLDALANCNPEFQKSGSLCDKPHHPFPPSLTVL